MSSANQFPCSQCGAALEFAPGRDALVCPYCGTSNSLPRSAQMVEELDFMSALADRSAADATIERLTVTCSACGAESALAPGVTADRCPFCGTAIVAQAASRRAIKPNAVMPFRIPADEASRLFRNWISSLWFAPRDLAQRARADGVRGAYVPYWTYDCHSETWYTGQRGENYTVTETYTATETRTTVIDGRTVSRSVPVTRTRTVTRVRWYPVSGRVVRDFDDVLVPASASLPRKLMDRLAPWNLSELVQYADHYLAGFVAEAYQTDLAGGFEQAKVLMEADIRQAICRDIGGDHQRISTMRTRWSDITFKHILLPLWISAFRYRDKSYRFVINGQTGRVAGERPYSAMKIAAAVVVALAVAAIIVLLMNWRA